MVNVCVYASIKTILLPSGFGEPSTSKDCVFLLACLVRHDTGLMAYAHLYVMSNALRLFQMACTALPSVAS